MKQYINNTRISFLGSLIAAVALLFSSCIKNYEPNETNFAGLKPMVLIPEGGLSTFSSQALTFPGTDATDTAIFHVNYAATNVAPVDETITIGIDQTALSTYNGLGGLQYELFPDSIMTVPTGASISSNYKTIYYHLIGNPIAGSYDEEWIRYNSGDTTGVPAYDLDLGTVIFGPIDPTDIEVGSLGVGENDIIGFTNTGGVLSNFTVSITPVAGITEGTPVLEQADPVNGIYRVY